MSILSLGCSHSTHTMLKAFASHLAPRSSAVQALIDQDIENAHFIARTGKPGYREILGEFRGISWSIFTETKESGEISFQITCSDSNIEKIYKDKVLNGDL